MDMTIEQFVSELAKKMEIDQLYVEDGNGNDLVVSGDTKFERVDVTFWNNVSNCADLTFIV